METARLPDIREIKRRMAEANDLFNKEVFGRRRFDTLDLIYTRDARILPPGAPMIVGLPAIKRFWSDMVTATHANSAVLS